MSTWQTMDWFDVPRYYDMVYLPGTAAEVRFVTAVADLYGARPARRWLEPACGSGRVAAELARGGRRRVTGYDLNENALRYALQRMQRRGLEVELVSDDLATFRRPGAFDAAYCAVNSVRYMRTGREAAAHLRNTADSLRPGGIYVVGLHLTDYERLVPDVEEWRVRRGRTEVTAVTVGWPADRAARSERLRTRLTVRAPSGERRFETLWTYRTYERRQWRELVRRSPFEMVAVYDFNYAFETEQEPAEAEYDCLFVLRRS